MKPKTSCVIAECDARTESENVGIEYIRNNYELYKGNIKQECGKPIEWFKYPVNSETTQIGKPIEWFKYPVNSETHIGKPIEWSKQKIQQDMKPKPICVIAECDARTESENVGIDYIRNNYELYKGNIKQLFDGEQKPKWNQIDDWFVSFDDLYETYLNDNGDNDDNDDNDD